MKISVGSIQSTWLLERGGVRTMSVRRLHWKRKETFWNIFAIGVFRCHLGSGVSQLFLCYQQQSYWGGRGGSANFISRFFFRNFGQIFFIHQWPLSLTVKGGIKISPHTQGDGGGCQIQQNFFQESKRRCKGYCVVEGGGADKRKCQGRLFISSMGQGQERFADFFIRKTPCSTFDFWSESRRFDSRRPANHVRVQYRLGMQNTPSCPVAWIPSIAGQIWCLD